MLRTAPDAISGPPSLSPHAKPGTASGSSKGELGKEGDVFRKVIGWSLAFLAFMCLIVYLQSTPVLSWMLPS